MAESELKFPLTWRAAAALFFFFLNVKRIIFAFTIVGRSINQPRSGLSAVV